MFVEFLYSVESLKYYSMNKSNCYVTLKIAIRWFFFCNSCLIRWPLTSKNTRELLRCDSPLASCSPQGMRQYEKNIRAGERKNQLKSIVGDSCVNFLHFLLNLIR